MSHLKIEDRLRLEHLLNEGRNFQEIANRLKKARSTIVREVRKHRMPKRDPRLTPSNNPTWHTSCPIWEASTEIASTMSPLSPSSKPYTERRS